MNWDALGAIAEFVGAVAVVISLAYVAVQVRQNTTAVRAASAKDSASTMRDWFSVVVRDEDMARIFAQGVEGLSNLDERDRVRFALLMFNFLKAIEDLHFQHESGLMDDQLWEGWHTLGAQYLTASGVQEYWSERYMGFSKGFQDYVNGLQPDPSVKRVSALAAEEGIQAGAPGGNST